MKIDILMVRESKYEVLQHFSRKIYEAFKDFGYDARLIPNAEIFMLPDARLPDLTIGFNGVPRDNEGRFLCDLIQRPHFTLLVDPPFRFLDLLKSPFILMACENKEDLNLLKLFHHPQGIFVPHAIEKDFTALPDKDKDLDIVLFATFIDAESRMESWKKEFPGILPDMMKQAVESAFSPPFVPYFETFFSLCKIHKEELGSDIYRNINLKGVLSSVEMAIKGKERASLVQAIKSLPVHIFGDSIDQRTWADALQGSKNITLHPGLPYQEAQQIIRKSKILLNPSLKNTFGAHERIFMGMAAESIVVTSWNGFLAEDFREGESILYYSPDRMDHIEGKILKCLQDKELRLQMGKLGREITMQKHTWHQRIQAFMPQVESRIG